MARPRAGEWLEDEVTGWRAQGVDIVVSLLEPSEIAELDLRREPDLCRASNIEFVSFAIPDRGVPASARETARLARDIARKIEDGKTIAVHCRAGIGRSAVIAACTLVCAGVEAKAAFEAIGKARGVAVPDTDAQRDWVIAFRDVLA